MDLSQSAASQPDESNESEESITAAPERVTRLHAGNRGPGVVPRLMFPGWGPKLWERPEAARPKPHEQRYGG